MQVVATLIISVLFYGCKANKMAETLDIGKTLDDEMFKSEDLKEDGVSFQRITAKEGYLISKVIQNYNFIWQRLSYKQECKHVDLYKRNDRPFLIAILVVKPNEESNFYFMNTISTWASISYKEFLSSKSRDPNFSGPVPDEKKKGSFTTMATFYAFLIMSICSLN
ncbi:hypothetical protein TpMuguga_01g01218 [Theileria parva strain Muguga]|uniref:Lipoprotein n=1 Tax=Theileria parva TaxID=5875 RepID=Q4N6F2_THEPA|nr:uncharacterized protein TpMuguga_01g01218 [Theileria parva strain Muguga]EAN34456.1 hypothetical protein TpMuguga_01g01218 [Theileria parva strain Muguga]|eukprot:XP_766739.1 hypothetical protein [Theileria parva strain Muguga]